MDTPEQPAAPRRRPATPEQVDLAGGLSKLAQRLDGLPRRLRGYITDLITGNATGYGADNLATILDELAVIMPEAARRIRLNRPPDPQREEQPWPTTRPTIPPPPPPQLPPPQTPSR